MLETVVAPHDGTFAMLRTFPTIRVGDWIGLLFVTAEPAGELRGA